MGNASAAGMRGIVVSAKAVRAMDDADISDLIAGTYGPSTNKATRNVNDEFLAATRTFGLPSPFDKSAMLEVIAKEIISARGAGTLSV